MAGFSLVLTLVLLVAANVCAAHGERRGGTLFLILFMGVLAQLCLVFSPVFMIFTALIVALWIGWRLVSNRPRTFAIASVLAALIAWSYPLAVFRENFAEHARLRQVFPVESLDARLPPKAVPTLSTQPTLDRLETFDNAQDFGWNHRHYRLKALHDGNVSAFGNTVGAGVGRMRILEPRTLSEPQLRVEDSPPVPQPSSPGHPAELFARTDRGIPTVEAEKAHREALLAFTSPVDMGYIAGPKQAAGFLSHRFRESPKLPAYEVLRIDLVGLLRHDKPVVYETEHLPAMAEAATAPKRALDAFETAGLESLRRGEDVSVIETATHARMLGAIRLGKKCASCHDGQRGDLLGAFTYVLKKSPH